MRLLAPKGWIGFAVRLFVLVGFVAAANITFARVFDDPDHHNQHSPVYYIAHAAFVGGPLIAFFLAVCVYQLRLQRKLWRLSRKDGLTGLNNRRTFFDLVEKARKVERAGVLLMLDADWFKKINDTYGHQAGDRCLKSIAYTLRRNLRQGDILGRVGGEEFAIYLRGAAISQARVIGERLTKPICFDTETTQHLTITLSIGAVVASPTISIDALFANADAALYDAKQAGRATYVLWNPKEETDDIAKTA